MSDGFYQSAELIINSDAIVIFAGAGMGVDSGLEQFRGDNGLWTKHLTVDGKAIKYLDLMTHSAFDEMPHQAWALIGYLINKFNDTKPHLGFQYLLEMLKDKEYFVITSNVDEHFQKAGFNENCILEVHGSVNYMQCMDVLEWEIYLTPEIKIDNANFVALEPLPKCPKCGSNCRPNVALFGDWFWVTSKSAHQQKRYNTWLKEAKEKGNKLLAIEIGAGKTLATIRQSAERFTNIGYPLIRINPFDSEVYQPTHISIPYTAKASLEKIFNQFKKL